MISNFNWALKTAPHVLLILVIVSFVFGLITTLGQPVGPVAAVAASLNAGLIPFVAAALLYRADPYHTTLSQAKRSDQNA